jgi:hypothetical protein
MFRDEAVIYSTLIIIVEMLIIFLLEISFLG